MNRHAVEPNTQKAFVMSRQRRRAGYQLLQQEGPDWNGPITGTSKDPTCHISITMNPDFNSDFCLGWLKARLLSPYASSLRFLLETSVETFQSLQILRKWVAASVYSQRRISWTQLVGPLVQRLCRPAPTNSAHFVTDHISVASYYYTILDTSNTLMNPGGQSTQKTVRRGCPKTVIPMEPG